MISNPYFRWRSSLLVLSLLIMLAVIQMPGRASAAYIACSGDPIIYLSNGDQLSITVDIQSNADLVKSVTYVVHGPPGTKVTSITYTGGAFIGKENFKYYADGTAGHYTTDTLVNDSLLVSSTAATSFNQYSAFATGLSKDHLIVTVGP